MKKNIITYSLIVLVISICLSFAYFNSNYFYAKKLINMIKAENIEGIHQILERKPSCVNAYPSITPKIWHSAMNVRVTYPLTEACFTDNIEIIGLLISHGADVNCNDGLTPLSVTYSEKQENWYAISLLLIKNGASLDYSTEYSGNNSSVLQDIVHPRPGGNATDYIPEKSDEVHSAFYYAIDNCDHTSVDWMWVLQHCVSFNRTEIVEFLLMNGYCDVNDTSVGITALMFAARDSTPEMVQLLLEHGANKYFRSSDGRTAYDYAVEKNKADIISLLED